MVKKRKTKISIISGYFYPHPTVASIRVTHLYRYLSRYPDLGVEVITDALNREYRFGAMNPLDVSRVNYLKTYRNSFEKKLLTEANPSYRLLGKTFFYSAVQGRLARALAGSDIWKSSDLLYISTPPFRYFLKFALDIKRSDPQKKIVLEYRDEWIDGLTAYAEKNSLIHPYNLPKSLYRKGRYHLLRRSAERLEKEAITAADAVVVVSPPMKENLIRRIPQLEEKKVHCVPNGISDREIDEFDRLRKKKISPGGSGLSLIYAGLLFGPQDIRPLLRSLERLRDEKTVSPDEISLRIYGNHRQHIREWPGRFKRLVEFRDRVCRSEIFRQYFLHDAAVLIVGDWPGADSIMTGKIFELIESGRPILALLPPKRDGCARRLLDKTDAAYFADIGDEKMIGERILELLQRKKEGTLDKARRNMDWFHRNYHYHNLCRKLYLECLYPLIEE